MMKKINLLCMSLLLAATMFSLSNLTYAKTLTGSNLATAISSAVQKENNSKQNVSTMTYGGKDISRRLVATSDESLWMGQQPMLVG